MLNNVKKRIEENNKKIEELLDELNHISYSKTHEGYTDEEHARFVQSLLYDIEYENAHLISKYN